MSHKTPLFWSYRARARTALGAPISLWELVPEPFGWGRFGICESSWLRQSDALRRRGEPVLESGQGPGSGAA